MGIKAHGIGRDRSSSFGRSQDQATVSPLYSLGFGHEADGRDVIRTNPEAFRGRGALQIFKDEGFGLYKGASWTAARNAPGSFAVRTFFPISARYRTDERRQLFGGSAFTKEYLFGLEDYRSATWYQNFVASIAGSVSSIVVSQPLDVIKVSLPLCSEMGTRTD